jgi:hypothetical protein
MPGLLDGWAGAAAVSASAAATLARDDARGLVGINASAHSESDDGVEGELSQCRDGTRWDDVTDFEPMVGFPSFLLSFDCVFAPIPTTLIAFSHPFPLPAPLLY